MPILRIISLVLLFIILPGYSEEPKAVNIFDDVTLSDVDFKDCPLEEVLAYVNQRIREVANRDQPKKGISFYVPSKIDAQHDDSIGSGELTAKDEGGIRITFQAKKITVRLLLQEIGRQAKLHIYKIDDKIFVTSNKIQKVYEVPE